jgi:hypothetical protein
LVQLKFANKRLEAQNDEPQWGELEAEWRVSEADSANQQRAAHRWTHNERHLQSQRAQKRKTKEKGLGAWG